MTRAPSLLHFLKDKVPGPFPLRSHGNPADSPDDQDQLCPFKIRVGADRPKTDWKTHSLRSGTRGGKPRRVRGTVDYQKLVEGISSRVSDMGHRGSERGFEAHALPLSPLIGLP